MFMVLLFNIGCLVLMVATPPLGFALFVGVPAVAGAIALAVAVARHTKGASRIGM